MAGRKDLEKEVGLGMADVKEVKLVTDEFKSVWDKQSGLRESQDGGKWPMVSQMIVRQLMKAGMCLFSVF